MEAVGAPLEASRMTRAQVRREGVPDLALRGSRRFGLDQHLRPLDAEQTFLFSQVRRVIGVDLKPLLVVVEEGEAHRQAVGNLEQGFEGVGALGHDV